MVSKNTQTQNINKSRAKNAFWHTNTCKTYMFHFVWLYGIQKLLHTNKRASWYIFGIFITKWHENDWCCMQMVMAIQNVTVEWNTRISFTFQYISKRHRHFHTMRAYSTIPYLFFLVWYNGDVHTFVLLWFGILWQFGNVTLENILLACYWSM